ncbi:MAG: zinc ribbon domain-containing protein [Lachnospiraceae bacterium]|nr:zinc ribbon domain-containing protein [Lachnospiraceae bacterium]
MFCPNCGAEITSPAKFCPKCGSPIAAPQSAPAPAPQPQPTPAPQPQPTPAPQPQPTPAPGQFQGQPAPGQFQGQPAPAAKPKSKKGLIIGICAAVAVVAAIVVLIVLDPFGGTKLDLGSYLSVSYVGGNSRGAASLEYDYLKTFEDIVADKKLDASGVDFDKGLIPDEIMPYVEFVDGICVYVSESGRDDWTEIIWEEYRGSDGNGLSNGDRFTVRITAPEDQAKELGIKASEFTGEFTVEGLPDIPSYDPFDLVDISFDGVSGSASLNIEVKPEYEDIIDYWDFEADTEYDLSNGDAVKITFDYSPDYFDFIPTSTEKTITVEGLPFYITKFEQIDEATLSALQAAALEKLKESTAMIKDASFSDPEYYGYFLNSAPKPNAYDNNELYLIYRTLVTPTTPDLMPFYVYLPANFAYVLASDPELEEAILFSTPGYFNWYGISTDGYVHPHEACEKLLEDATEGWNTEFGGPIAAFETSDGLVTSLSEINEALTSVLHANALAIAEKEVNRYYSDSYTFSGWEAAGEYFAYKPGDDQGLVCIIKVQAATADNTVLTLYFAVSYDEICITDGILIPEEYNMMVTDDMGLPFGTPDLMDFHEYYRSESEAGGYKLEYRGADLEAVAVS